MTVIAFLFHYYKHDKISFPLLKIFPIPNKATPKRHWYGYDNEYQ